MAFARARAAALAGWVRAADSRGGSALRLGLLLAVGWLAWRLIHRVPVLLWALVSAWGIAAWRTAPATVPSAPQETTAAAPADETDQAAAEAAFRQLLAGAVGDRNGVHLKTVVALLHEHGLLTDWGVSEVRAQCEALGIPVRRSLKISGQVQMGVHRDDLPAPLAAPSPFPLDEPPASTSTAA
ncbi:hypothetical protein [Streptomyces sp. WAC 06738]|uniref:hypothetical protein n=1 Tax=Streptomyces sp. WAC 06738 TaxID=2203210 RepID=UPI000F778FBD|nr:hypothetical protein [Streptomyces sp. WAC 06738]